MRSKKATQEFYVNLLGFSVIGNYEQYLMLQKDQIEIHFFEFKKLDLLQNYGQVYIRTNDIDGLYLLMKNNKCPIHPNGSLELKPWGQKEFAVLDPDHNLLTFGQVI